MMRCTITGSNGRERIEREKPLRTFDAAQRVTPDRDKPTTLQSRHRFRESLRQQDAALDRTAHRGDAGDFIDRRSDDGEIEPLVAADIAIEHRSEEHTSELQS